jgi:DNA-directed RNA polymerase specialized sigma24 family protein
VSAEARPAGRPSRGGATIFAADSTKERARAPNGTWFVPEPEGRAGEPLSPPEIQLLEDAADGYSLAETAQRQRCSIETVKSSRRAVFLKRGARNTPHAVGIALRRHHRAASWVVREDDAGSLEVAADSGDSVRRVLIPETFLADVNAALEQLPDYAARIFVLRSVEDYSFEEIAAEMGCTVEAAGEVYELACGAVWEALSESDGRMPGGRRLPA